MLGYGSVGAPLMSISSMEMAGRHNACRINGVYTSIPYVNAERLIQNINEDPQMNVLVAFTLTNHFRFLCTVHKIRRIASFEGTHLSEGICKLCIHIFHSRGYLTFKSKRVMEVQSRCINHGEKKTVVFGLAYFNASSVDGARTLSRTREEPFEVRSLFRSGSGGDLGGLEEQP